MVITVDPHARDFTGLSTDKKPVPGDLGADGNRIERGVTVVTGSRFLETDTGRESIFIENQWLSLGNTFHEAVLVGLSRAVIALEKLAEK